MTDMTSEEYRELAELCKETADNLLRINEATKGLWLNNKKCFTDAADRLYPDVANRFAELAIYAQRHEDAERQLREDIKTLIYVAPSESGVAGTVDAIIRRVREADKG